jgi:hypothetical protein
LEDRSNEVSKLDRFAQSRSGAPVDSDPFSFSQHLRMVRRQPNPMAAALSKLRLFTACARPRHQGSHLVKPLLRFWGERGCLSIHQAEAAGFSFALIGQRACGGLECYSSLSSFDSLAAIPRRWRRSMSRIIGVTVTPCSTIEISTVKVAALQTTSIFSKFGF